MEGDDYGWTNAHGRPRPKLVTSYFRLDHVGEVELTFEEDGLSWIPRKNGENEQDKSSCLGLITKSKTEKKFCDIYATDFINWGSIHEPIVPASRTHFLFKESKMYRFVVHGFQKSKTQNSPWIPTSYIFGHEDVKICHTCVEQINTYLNLQVGRPKSLLVFVHPLSGKGKGLITWESVLPIFSRAKIRTKVVVTERAGHAFDVMSSIADSELNSFDGVIAVGGDGFFNEIVNGFLLSRHNAPYPPAPTELLASAGNSSRYASQTVYNYSSNNDAAEHGEDEDPLLGRSEAFGSVCPKTRTRAGSVCPDSHHVHPVPHEWFRFGIIPAGSTDAIVICTTGTRDAATSALQIVLGRRSRLDAAQIVRWKTSPSSTDAPSVRYAISFIGYGFYGDVIMESEKYRWMGPKRYDYAGTKVFLKHKSYEAEVAYIENPSSNPSAEEAHVTRGPWQKWRLKRNSDKMTCRVNCSVCSETTESRTNAEDSRWLRSKGHFISVGGAVIACRNERAPDGLVADAHLADGFLHLILVKDCPRPHYLWHLTQLARKGGNPLDFEFVEHHKTPAFTFMSPTTESAWNLDGELFPACQLSAQVFRGLISIFACGPEV